VKSQARWIFEWRFLIAIAMVLLTVNRQFRASIASTVVASGSCWNTSLRYSKGSSPLARAVITSENRLALAWAPTLS